MESLRRYFLDTEFYPDADGHSHPISYGLIAEHDRGSGFYAIAAEFNKAACTNAWINEHVVAKLDDNVPCLARPQMVDGLTAYMQPAKTMEFWARNGSYDFYHLCQTYGSMGLLLDRLKKEHGVEKVVFRDMNELHRQAGWPKLPKAPDDMAHISIVDATWDRDLFPELQRLAALHSVRPSQIIRTIGTGLRAWLKGPA